ncbi:MAG: hypothetical protein COX20_00380 [Desulfobacterales bacterium CG23_combo_of_CG06-09_8_20_14_all_52_9]|nr:MAG: hypothetical protein COX20_00380 [Desulfobacterales bacterium CG23_combo_of_CG06-09_8_20_14_all_52_9]
MNQPRAQKAGYRVIDHTADLGILIFAPTEKALYETAARALFALLVEGRASGKGSIKTLQLEGEDRADLMVIWLRELLYFWTGRGLLVQKADVTALDEHRLSATVWVYPYDPGRHLIQNDIKAVTYHQIQVNRTPSGWEAKVIFDV